jgi:hypothetical protein
MDFQAVANRVEGFLYRKSVQKLTPQDLESAKIWSMNMLRLNHPEWSEAQREKYYNSLLNIRVYVVDEWGRRMQG